MSNDTQLKREIEESIAAHLPAQVGEVLKKRLEQADRAERELASTKSALDLSLDQITRLHDEVATLKNRVSTEEKLAQIEKDLAERERNLQIEVLKIKLDASDQSAKFARDLAMGLVRNIEFRNSVFSSSSSSEPIINNGYASGTATRGSTDQSTTSNTAA